MKSAFPEQWRRCDEDTYIEYRLRGGTNLEVWADSTSISLGMGVDVYQMSVKDLECLMCILDRALQQHLYLSAHPGSEPLDQEEEWRRVP